MDHHPYSPDHTPSDFHPIWPLEKKVASKQVSKEAMTEAVTSWLQTPGTDLF